MGKPKSRSTVVVGYFSVQEAADYLRISERLLRDLLIDPLKPLPHFRIGSAGRLIRIRKVEIDEWLENFRSTSEIDIDEIVSELMM
ncbi:MAG: helix-turn-helix domain-containing protein [Desulfamplus sp.]|nr:helix-turn-helix domain-containing protein [Desulfamplus sp.]